MSILKTRARRAVENSWLPILKQNHCDGGNAESAASTVPKSPTHRTSRHMVPASQYLWDMVPANLLKNRQFGLQVPRASSTTSSKTDSLVYRCPAPPQKPDSLVYRCTTPPQQPPQRPTVSSTGAPRLFNNLLTTSLKTRRFDRCPTARTWSPPQSLGTELPTHPSQNNNNPQQQRQNTSLPCFSVGHVQNPLSASGNRWSRSGSVQSLIAAGRLPACVPIIPCSGIACTETGGVGDRKGGPYEWLALSLTPIKPRKKARVSGGR